MPCSKLCTQIGTGKLVECPALLKSSDGIHWEQSCCEEIGRLAQGFAPTVPKGTDTIHFIKFDQIPNDRSATYLRLVDRPMKANPRRVRFTVGGDRQDSTPGDISTKTADLTTSKILFNSVLSTPDAKFMGIDIKDFYLNTDMDHYQCMHIPVHVMPKAIMELYNLEPLTHNNKVYVEIRKGMCGLKEAGRIANDKLVPILAKAGYIQSSHIPGLFKHETRPVAFCLVVDDFGVKCVGREHDDAEHLIQTLKDAEHKITTDWKGTTFCGMTLKWDYNERTLKMSIPGYVQKALLRFEHPNPAKPQDSPYQCAPIQYGAKSQMTTVDTTPPLDKKGVKLLQQVVGVLLYYARAIDNTMLVALGTLASAQTQGTEATAKACAQLLDYAATHPDAAIKFTASDMILHIHSDASCLSEPNFSGRCFKQGETALLLKQDIPATKLCLPRHP